MTGLSISEFADRVTEIMPALMREFSRQETDEFYKLKITIPQLVVLNILAREGDMRMTDLANTINVTTAAMTGIINRLVRDGYVRRGSDAKDRRIIKVGATAKGLRAAKSAIEHQRKMVIRLFSVISPEERREYLRILTIIKDRIKG